MDARHDEIDTIRTEWAALKPELDTEAIDTIGRVLRASALVGRRGDGLLVRYGLTRGEFDILSALRRGDRPQSPGTLRTVSLASGPAITKRLRALEGRRLVARAANPSDGRGALIELMPEGVELIDEVFPQLLALERGLLAGIPAEARAGVVESLRVVLASVETVPPGTPTPHGAAGSAPPRAAAPAPLSPRR